MCEAAETYNDAAAVSIGFKKFVIDPDNMLPINNITR